MNDPLTVRAGETRVVRLFRLDLRPEELRFLRSEPGALADKLGVDRIDPEQADIVKVSDLGELGLAGYLTDGIGIPEAEIDTRREALDRLDGSVLILLSRAFGGRAAQIVPSRGVEFVAAWSRPGTDWTEKRRLTSESARPGPAAPGRQSPRQARAQARRTGAAIFAVVMALLALLIVAVLR